MPKFWFLLVFSVALGDLYVTAESVSRNHGQSATHVNSASSGDNARRARPPVRRIRTNGDGLIPPWPAAPTPSRP
jgi:hypothetical protein